MLSGQKNIIKKHYNIICSSVMPAEKSSARVIFQLTFYDSSYEVSKPNLRRAAFLFHRSPINNFFQLFVNKI